MGFRLQQKLMTLNDLEHQLTVLLSSFRVNYEFIFHFYGQQSNDRVRLMRTLVIN